MPQLPPIGAEVPAAFNLPPIGAEVLQQPDFSTTNEKDAAGNAVVDPNTVGTFASHVGRQINPMALGQMMPFPKSAGGGGWDAPLQALKNIGAAHEAVAHKAKEAYDAGDYLTAGVKAVEYLLPVIGPVLSESGDRIQQGKYAAGLGDAVGLALAMFGGKPAAEGVAAAKLKLPSILPKNPNAAEAAAVQFGQSRGIPVDAATATGNRYVKSAQAATEYTPLGALVAERARGATATALKRVSGELAEEAHPVAVTPEQAGQGVKASVQKLVGDLNAQATAAYERLRTIEADPKYSEVVHTAPHGSTAERRIMAKLAAGAEHGQAPSVGELSVMRQIEVELDSQPFKPGRLLEEIDGQGHSTSHYDPRAAGAPVYHDIGQESGSTMTRAETLAGLRKTLETGEWNQASRGALAVAKKRLLNSGQLGGPRLPEGAPLLGATERVSLPVNLKSTKGALRPLYDRLRRENSIVPLMGDKGRALVALDRIMEGPDYASLSIVDAALGDLKAMARADIPELRTQGQGLAAAAVKQLDRMVRDTAQRAGPEALSALEEGRNATIAKYQTGDVLEVIRDEPVQAYRQAVAPKDSGIKHLRQIRETAPSEIPKIGRAYLEDLFSQATAEGGFDKGARLQAEWAKLGHETKRILFPKPGQAQALDQFFLLVKKMQEPANSSKTALVSIATGGSVAAVMNPTTGIPLVLATGALAKLLHSPSGVKALTSAASYSLSRTPVPKAVQAAAYADVVKAAREVGAAMTLPKAADDEAQRAKP